MELRPYRLSGSSGLRRVAGLVANAAAEWAARWGIDGSGLSVQCQPASAAAGPELEAGYLWRQRWHGNGASVWCTWSAQPGTEFARLMFPGSEGEHALEASIAPAMGSAALDALLETLQQIGCEIRPAVTQLQPAPDGAAVHASGYVVIGMQVGPVRMRLLADSGWVAQSLAAGPAADATPALAPLRPVALGKSIERVAVPLTVIAGEVEIGAGSVLTIGVGDVIRLGTAADEPFALVLPDGATLCHGLIGRSGGGLAVEVTLHP
jgi:hypothetical protein